jgi:hypothetical protein
MSFIAKSPLDKENQVQMPMGRQIQGGPTVDMGSPITDLAMDAAPAVAEAAFKTGANALAGAGGGAGTLANIGTALGGVAAPTAASAAPVLGAVGTAGGLGAAGAGAGLAAAAPAAAATTGAAAAGAGAAGMAAMAPMLAAAGPFALMALPFLLKDGTPGVPEMDYGPDPLQGYMNGTNKVPGYKNGIPGVPGLAGMAMDKFGIKSPMSVVGKALGFSNGTNSVPGYMNGTSSITPTTAMHLAGGKDTVPALLVPGEAVIGSAAAQNPANKADINRMLNETKSANLFAEGKDPNNFEKLPEGNQMASMSGPLSDKTQREQMLSLQKMSLINKAAEAEEARKQEIHELKLAQMYEKYRSSITT